MARIKTVCMTCGNIVSVSGNGATSGGDYMDEKIHYVKNCNACPKNLPSFVKNPPGCILIIIALIALFIIIFAN